MVFFRRRETDKDDPWLYEKMILFAVGAAAALAGMLLDESWIIILAALLLVTGMALRLVPRKGREGEDED